MSEERLQEIKDSIELQYTLAKIKGYDNALLFTNEEEELIEEIERLNKQLQLISDEFLKYDWENSSKEQIINQLKSLYNSIFKGSDK